MPVIEAIAMLFSGISFVLTFVYAAQFFKTIPDFNTDALTNMLFSAIVCLVSVGAFSYIELTKP